MLGLSVIILFKSLLHVFCSLVFSAHNSSEEGQAIFWKIRILGQATQDFEIDEKYLPTKLSPAYTDAKIKENLVKKTVGKIHNSRESGTLAIPDHFSSGDFEEIETRVMALVERSQNKVVDGTSFAHLCKVCGKEGRGKNIKDHIEANHLEGINIPCNLCDKTFRSRNGLRLHKKQHQSWIMKPLSQNIQVQKCFETPQQTQMLMDRNNLKVWINLRRHKSTNHSL